MLDLMAEKSQERLPLMVSLQPDARKIVEKIREDTGIPQTEALKRLLEWFAGLDRKLRRAILDNDPATQAELVRLAFTGMATDEVFRRAADMDLASLADLMRAVAARFDAVIAGDKAARPNKIGRLPAPEPARSAQTQKK